MEWLAHFGYIRMHEQSESDYFDRRLYPDIRTYIFSFLIRTDSGRYEDIIASLQVYKTLSEVCKVFRKTAKDSFKQHLLLSLKKMKYSNQWIKRKCESGEHEQYPKLYLAMIDNNLTAVEELLNNGANINQNIYRGTPLYWFVLEKYRECFCVPCKQYHEGASILKNEQKRNNIIKVIELLLSHNADPTNLDIIPEGGHEIYSPLDFVEKSGDTEVFNKLKTAMKNYKNAKNKATKTSWCPIQ
jgi:hypothetical protein